MLFCQDKAWGMRIHKNKLYSQHRSFDLPLLLTVVILVTFGLVMVYDASVIQALRDYKDSYYYIRQQIVWVILGALAAGLLSVFDYRKLKPLAMLALIVSFILMLAVFIPGLGISGGGAHRWLKLGFITIQPAEIIKLTGVIYMAALFEKGVKVIPFVVLVVAVGLITAVLQKDLGSSLVFVCTAALVYLGSGGKILHLLIFISTTVLGMLALIFTSDYRSKRILAFLDPFSDTQGFTYHISQVLIALGSGGLFGLGLGQSRQKFEYIPEVSTDSIFGIVGEELGFVGAVVVLILFGILITRGLKISVNAPDSFGKILALGLTSWLGVQAIINLSSMVALTPLTGVPLPFISYGGSALVANLMAVGILLSISRHSSSSSA